MWFALARSERLNVLANFDTKASFNFENAFKVNYKPQVDAISRPGAARRFWASNDMTA